MKNTLLFLVENARSKSSEVVRVIWLMKINPLFQITLRIEIVSSETAKQTISRFGLDMVTIVVV